MFQVNIENKLIKSYNKKKNEAIHSFFIKHFLLFRKYCKTAIYFFMIIVSKKALVSFSTIIISFETIGEANT